MKVAYTKEQMDILWAQFAKIVWDIRKEEEIAHKWKEMGKRSALKEKILKELRKRA